MTDISPKGIPFLLKDTSVHSLLTPETVAVNLLDSLIILLTSQRVNTSEYHTLSHKYK